ncbi:hypothetical protein NEAUS04_1635 [Nematocida ausubeli]|nr:hypothetical protein NEAUS04_1635 [Nematocida ausubeli]
MGNSQLGESVMRSIERKLPIAGINFSVIAAGALFSYTERGRAMLTVLKQGAVLDFLLLTMTITLVLMKAVAYAYETEEVYSNKQKKNLAMLETVLGTLGVVILGGVAASPMCMIMAVGTAFMLRGEKMFKHLASIIGAVGLAVFVMSNPNMPPYVYTVLISAGVSFCILGMLRLETIVKNQSATMLVHYFTLVSIILAALIYSPLAFIMLPLVLFCAINSHYLDENVQKIPGVGYVYRKIVGLLKKPSRIYMVAIRLTKVLIPTVVIGMGVLYFSAWYTDNPIILSQLGIKVTNESPIFATISSGLGYVVDSSIYVVNTVYMALRPRAVGEYILKSIGVDPLEVSNSNRIFVQIASVVYKALVFMDSILASIVVFAGAIVNVLAGIVCAVALKPLKIYGFVLNLGKWALSKVLYVIDTLLYYCLGITTNLYAVTSPNAQPAPSILSRAASVVLYPLTLMKMLFRKTPAGAGTTVSGRSTGNALTAVYGLLINVLFVLFGAYSCMFFTTNGKDMASTKTISFESYGVSPVMGDRPLSIDKELVNVRRDTFYQKFFDAYCETATVFTDVNGNGAFLEEEFVNKTLKSGYNPMNQYTNDQICKPVASFQEEFQEKIRKIGAIAASFTADEKAALKSILQYFPKVRGKKGMSVQEKDLEDDLKDALKAKKDPKKIKPTALENILGLKKSAKEVQKLADQKYIKAKVHMVEYYRKYYYNFYILAQYFLDNMNPSILHAVSSSAVETYNAVLPTNYSDISDEYLKTIVQLRTAIIKKELPFLTEVQAAARHHKTLLRKMEAEGVIQKGEKQKEGFFLNGVGKCIDYNSVLEEDTDLFVYHEKISLEKDAQFIHFKSSVSTTPKPSGSPFIIGSSMGIDLSIKNAESTVVSISVNDTPVCARVIPADRTKNVLIDMKIPLETIRKSSISNPSDASLAKITVRMFIGHASLLSTNTYQIEL